MALDCEFLASEELKILRDIQRLMQALVIAILGDLSSVSLEQTL